MRVFKEMWVGNAKKLSTSVSTLYTGMLLYTCLQGICGIFLYRLHILL